MEIPLFFVVVLPFVSADTVVFTILPFVFTMTLAFLSADTGVLTVILFVLLRS